MPNFFQTALSAGREAVRATAGETVTYHRADASVEVTAVPGLTNVEIDNAEGMAVSSTVRDFLIEADTLELVGTIIDPALGDLIRVRDPETLTVKVYEVSPIGGERCFRPSGTDARTLRIHTRHIDTEND